MAVKGNGKAGAGSGAPPGIREYAATRRAFSWEEARRELDGLPGGAGLNIAHEAVDRHAAGPRANQLALRVLSAGGAPTDYSYAALSRASSRFASVLQALGIAPGDRVFTLAGRIPELYVAALGTLKNRSVFSPLFAAFGPEPVQARVGPGGGRVLVTTASLYRRKVRPVRAALPRLEFVLLIDGVPPDLDDVGLYDLEELMSCADDSYVIGPTAPDDIALLHFTSGTTGRPKGAVHVHEAVVTHLASARTALDLGPGDVFWCTADPGWVTGTSYGIIAPLAIGATLIVDREEFDAARWYRILGEEKINVWYTAPTAVRMLMRYGDRLPPGTDLSSVRFAASVGEPLNPEAVLWSQRVLGLPIHDNWWQTETGGIMIANLRSLPIRPGSMGVPLPGIEAGIVRREKDGSVRQVTASGREGELALRPGWPSMFRGYLNDAERYAKCFAGGWYLSGDLARRDQDGYFWFVGRADDVIKSSGHLIGPVEVENVLMEHPGVVEAGVIGVPDPVAGETVKAFVALRDGYDAGPALERELMALARRRLGPAVAPRAIAFRQRLPKTRSGKIMRRLLRARELGLPEGDTSTLEEDA